MLLLLFVSYFYDLTLQKLNKCYWLCWCWWCCFKKEIIPNLVNPLCMNRTSNMLLWHDSFCAKGSHWGWLSVFANLWEFWVIFFRCLYTFYVEYCCLLSKLLFFWSLNVIVFVAVVGTALLCQSAIRLLTMTWWHPIKKI